MEVDRKEIVNTARATGFQPDIIEKAYRLALLLSEIRNHPALSKELVLKGGTAINFIYLPLPRLSIDLDFNFIGGLTKEEAELKRKDMSLYFNSIFAFLKYSVSQREEYGIQQYFLSYTNSASNKDMIKVEVNFLMRISLLPNVEREIRIPFLRNQNVTVRSLALEEIYGEKIRALLTRGAARDLFDVYSLLANRVKLNKTILKRMVIFFGSLVREDCRQFSKDSLNRISDRDIKTDLLPLLRKGATPLREQMVKVVNPLLAYVLALNKTQQEYIDTFFKGEYRPELLFRQKEITGLVELLKNHPMALWKQQHLKGWLGRQVVVSNIESASR